MRYLTSAMLAALVLVTAGLASWMPWDRAPADTPQTASIEALEQDGIPQLPLLDPPEDPVEVVKIPVRQPAPLPDRADVRWVALTAYSSTPDQTDDTPFITAAGTRVRDGVVAVSRDLEARGWRFGTAVVIVHVTGKRCGGAARELVGRVLVVEDRMHRRKRNQIDVWRESRRAALAVGRCNALVAALPTPPTVTDK